MTLVEEYACWRPTPQQENLLRAALLSEDAALEAWGKWKSSVDIENLDGGSYRLLPLLYTNLIKHSVRDPLIARLKSVYRHTWSKNQMLLRTAAILLDRFREQGIETIALKGFSMVSLYYKDWGARPMSDLDVLVRADKAELAMKALAEQGCKSTCPEPRRLIGARHSTDFTNSAGRSIDLHWHLMWECCREGDDDDFWEAAIPVGAGEIQTLALCPADQLLHVCVHGSMWNPNPPFRWAADALTIIRSAGAEVDWNRLLDQADRRRLALPVGRMLFWLRESLQARVPEAVLREMNSVRATMGERIEYRVKMRRMRGLSSLAIFWFMHRRSREGFIRRLIEFPRYLQYNWGLERLYQVPLYMSIRGAQRNARRLLARLGWSQQKTFP